MAICVGFVIDYLEVRASRLVRGLLYCLEMRGNRRGLYGSYKEVAALERL